MSAQCATGLPAGSPGRPGPPGRFHAPARGRAGMACLVPRVGVWCRRGASKWLIYKGKRAPGRSMYHGLYHTLEATLRSSAS